jgi:Alcohol dehydrogenase transcription factor Myb/SANT-like
MSVTEWSDQKVYELIKLYENNPCLYDVQLKDYHNRNAKRLALQKISEDLGSQHALFTNPSF